MNAEENEGAVERAPEGRLAAREYYEMHVTHRAHVFNLMLVFVGAAGVAYTTALADDHRTVAGYIAGISAFSVMAFLCVNEVTLRKILHCKPFLSSGADGLARLYEESPRVLGMGDRAWKRLIHAVLAVSFILGAVYALKTPGPSDTRGWKW